MTDTLLVLCKLSVLREHVARARRRRPASVEAFRHMDGTALSEPSAVTDRRRPCAAR